MSAEPENGFETAKILYEHVSKLVDDDRATADHVVQKIDKLLIIDSGLVIVFGYGLSKLGWAGESILRTPMIVLAIVTAAMILVSFVSGVRCLFAFDRRVPALLLIRERIKSGEAFKDSPTATYLSLTENMAKSANENRTESYLKGRWAKINNWSTIAGAIAVSIFVSICVIGSLNKEWRSQDVGSTTNAAR